MDDAKLQEANRQIKALFGQTPDWVTFYREVFGLGGIVRQLFTTQAALQAVGTTSDYLEWQAMLGKLRLDGPTVPEDREPTRVITVRLPKSLHENLQLEAHEGHSSMNQLCISKLMMPLGPNHAPKPHLQLAMAGAR